MFFIPFNDFTFSETANNKKISEVKIVAKLFLSYHHKIIYTHLYSEILWLRSGIL